MAVDPVPQRDESYVLTILSLVSPMMMALSDFNEPLKLANVFLFEPPSCEHQVIFPHQPQNVGVLRNDETTYSAQLKMPDSSSRRLLKKNWHTGKPHPGGLSQGFNAQPNPTARRFEGHDPGI